MKMKWFKTVLATGMIFALNAGTTHAEQVDSEPPTTFNWENFEQTQYQPTKFKIPTNWENPDQFEQPEFLVGGIAKEVVSKILPVSVEARLFFPRLDVNVKSDNIFYNGGKVGLKDTLGFGNDKAPEIILRYKRFTMDYINVTGDGKKFFSSSNPITFKGDGIFGDVKSDSTFQYLKLNVTNPIISVLGTGVDWSYGLTGVYWKGKVNGDSNNVADQISNITNKKSFGAPIPTIGVGAHASLLDTLIVNAQISGLPMGGYGHFYDLEVGLRFNPLDILGISLGYRKINATIKHSDDDDTLDLNGPYFGLRVDF